VPHVRLCSVAGCIFTASGEFDGFAVCELHDSPKVLAILEVLKCPGSFWCQGRPIVLPVGDLEEDHLVPVYGNPLDPVDSPVFKDLYEGETFILSCYDLLR